MARNVFFSFHYRNDFWRTQQVRNIGALDGQKLYTPNEWEEVKKKGSAAIEKWIDGSLVGKSCLVVLVGSETASRPWVVKEIIKGWNAGKGVVAIRINKLLDANGNSSTAGANPLDQVALKNGTVSLSSYAQLITPVGADSKAVYASIQANIEQWIEDAIAIRNNYKP
ncbi:TIR domain-containing protein [Stutzerimonas xanthomarina]|uniref:MTH538 TIR-like domain n=2 Tax=Stutzerimonas xanthomarina TaxID=271420 RepID=A0A1M5PLV9_9GAMM|nr:TIR domain-containing protein [Stutzerimonas xanthomarina]MCP9338172.1 TIR domain-containing protein [Stutzerimonas xanthomarina]SEH73609.1 MTH538 TIR-like domain [Stutzerimonas xanthomarina]SHH02519.1 MTH538 TIR-like domain [Stutzerimonas xanthomarina DSM 18231]